MPTGTTSATYLRVRLLVVSRRARHTVPMVMDVRSAARIEVAIIGSFRQHFDDVLQARSCCAGAGLVVTTPAGSSVLDRTVEFVRLDNDDVALADPAVQSVATARILAADAVYVVAPGGYVGRTTCYELGRAIEARKPVYFSELPHDLPVSVPATHIMAAPAFAAHVTAGLHHWWDPDPSESPLPGTADMKKAGGR